ncbi:MAG TPA: alpha/beta hydrolase [Gemmataceae bacterium]|nr:alpha/beta hydrolase [Gemmataceae bacterium]
MPQPISPSGRTVIPVAHGQLEAILREPEAPRAAAVVCHPHPRGGGTLNNNVVYRLAKALVEGGVAALRFNFRGVGASTGSYDDGVGEEDDARAALDFLAARHPTLPLWMAGFSFGARVGLSVGARDARVGKLLGVGLALSMFDYRFLGACDKPKAIIQASDDEFGGRAEIEAAVQQMAEPKRLWIVDGATHLFPGRLDPFEAAAREAVAFLDA